MADGVNCALPNQHTPNGFYNIERMVHLCLTKGSRVLLCGSCAEARGLKELTIIDNAELSNMAELTKIIVNSDKVLTF